MMFIDRDNRAYVIGEQGALSPLPKILFHGTELGNLMSLWARGLVSTGSDTLTTSPSQALYFGRLHYPKSPIVVTCWYPKEGDVEPVKTNVDGERWTANTANLLIKGQRMEAVFSGDPPIDDYLLELEQEILNQQDASNRRLTARMHSLLRMSHVQTFSRRAVPSIAKDVVDAMMLHGDQLRAANEQEFSPQDLKRRSLAFKII